MQLLTNDKFGSYTLAELAMQERYFISVLKEHEQTPATRCFLEWMDTKNAPLNY